MATQPQIRRLNPEHLDALADQRDALKAELEGINEALAAQVEAFGFTPAHAEKSKRLIGEKWQATLSYGDSTEIRDAAVETIKRSCPIGLFSKLFREVRQYKLASGASLLLAGTLPEGAPKHLRQLFAAAVVIKARAPALRIELLKGAE